MLGNKGWLLAAGVGLLVAGGVEAGRFAVYRYVLEPASQTTDGNTADLPAMMAEIRELNAKLAALPAKAADTPVTREPTPTAPATAMSFAFGTAAAATPPQPAKPEYQAYLKLRGGERPVNAAQICDNLFWNMDRYVRRLNDSTDDSGPEYNEIRMGNFLTMAVLFDCDRDRIRDAVVTLLPVE